jgi:hypothetical protein
LLYKDSQATMTKCSKHIVVAAAIVLAMTLPIGALAGGKVGGGGRPHEEGQTGVSKLTVSKRTDTSSTKVFTSGTVSKKTSAEKTTSKKKVTKPDLYQQIDGSVKGESMEDRHKDW